MRKVAIAAGDPRAEDSARFYSQAFAALTDPVGNGIRLLRGTVASEAVLFARDVKDGRLPG